MRPNPLSTSVASSPWLCVMLLEDTVELHWDKKKKTAHLSQHQLPSRQGGELAVPLMDWQWPHITAAPGFPTASLMSPLPAISLCIPFPFLRHSQG